MSYLEFEDILRLVRQIEQQRGKHIKQVLSTIERILDADPSIEASVKKAVRKSVLDGMNNYTRTIYSMIGYEVEA